MVGASAVIVKACTTCASGAETDDYFLGAQNVADVQPPSKLTVTDKAGAADGNGVIVGAATIQLTPEQVRVGVDVSNCVR